MRRYFDEYRGLRETIGHVEPLAPALRAARHPRRRWPPTGASCASQGDRAERRAAGPRASVVHHGGRKVFAALGSRAERAAAAACSARCRSRVAPARRPGPRRSSAGGAAAAAPPYDVDRRVRSATGPAPLLAAYPGMADRERLHIAFVVPPFNVGSRRPLHRSSRSSQRLERHGPHVLDLGARPVRRQPHASGRRSAARRSPSTSRPSRRRCSSSFDEWYGADVVVATGWQTVYPALELTGCRARAYLVNDHEPEFFADLGRARSGRRATYGLGLYGIVASPWLRDLLRRPLRRPGRRRSNYGVDHDVYRPRPVARRRDTVVAYARAVTPRRAVALAFLALAELNRRRPDARIVLFGNSSRSADAVRVRGRRGRRRTSSSPGCSPRPPSGLCLSLTNYSLVPREMLACGLPCVELDRPSTRSVFGADGPVALAALTPARSPTRSSACSTTRPNGSGAPTPGASSCEDQTWDVSAEQVERELRNALRVRGG